MVQYYAWRDYLSKNLTRWPLQMACIVLLTMKQLELLICSIYTRVDNLFSHCFCRNGTELL